MAKRKPKRTYKKRVRLPAVILPDDQVVMPMGTGRPSAYRPEYAVIAARVCALYGATVDELSKFFGVALDTIKEWMDAHEDFSAALKGSRSLADLKANESLFNRACGYSHPAEKIFMVERTTTRTAADGTVTTTTSKRPVRVPYIERYPPDTTALIYWTKNRQPGVWKNKEKDDTDAATDKSAGEMHYHVHMEMPKPAAQNEDRSYRDGPVIEHRRSEGGDSTTG